MFSQWFTIVEPVTRIKVLKSATKESKTKIWNMTVLEGVQDIFGRMLAAITKTSDVLDLRHLLSRRYRFLLPIVM